MYVGVQCEVKIPPRQSIDCSALTALQNSISISTAPLLLTPEATKTTQIAFFRRLEEDEP